MGRLVFAALFVAFGVALPTIFHGVGMGGPVFLPMHIPVLLAGLTLGPVTGLIVGLVTPLLTFLLTGMPPVTPPILPLVMVELGTYGVVAGWFAGCVNRGRGGVWVPLLAAMAAGRLALGFAVAAAAASMGFRASPVPYVTGAVVTGLPGILVQLLLVPVLVRLISRLPAVVRLSPQTRPHCR